MRAGVGPGVPVGVAAGAGSVCVGASMTFNIAVVEPWDRTSALADHRIPTMAPNTISPNTIPPMIILKLNRFLIVPEYDYIGSRKNVSARMM